MEIWKKSAELEGFVKEPTEIKWVPLIGFFIASLILLAFSTMGVMFMVQMGWIN